LCAPFISYLKDTAQIKPKNKQMANAEINMQLVLQLEEKCCAFNKYL